MRIDTKMNIDREASVRLLEELSRSYLSGEMNGRAYVRAAELIVELGELDETEPEFDEFRLILASYSPSGGEQLVDDSTLRKVVEAKLSRWPS
jgi:hypothetical protein